MGKVTDFGHPTVELRFKTVETGSGQELLAVVHDAETGEILISGDSLKKIAGWLRAMQYTWLEGSNGIWHQ